MISKQISKWVKYPEYGKNFKIMLTAYDFWKIICYHNSSYTNVAKFRCTFVDILKTKLEVYYEKAYKDPERCDLYRIDDHNTVHRHTYGKRRIKRILYLYRFERFGHHNRCQYIHFGQNNRTVNSRRISGHKYRRWCIQVLHLADFNNDT